MESEGEGEGAVAAVGGEVVEGIDAGGSDDLVVEAEGCAVADGDGGVELVGGVDGEVEVDGAVAAGLGVEAVDV